MAKHEFLLPDELGWKCNDEISDYIDKWVKKMPKEYGHSMWAWQVAKAEMMDNVYAIIKKYQLKTSKEK